MPREHEDFRDNYEKLSEFFGEKRLLSRADVARYCGRDYRTGMKRFDIPKDGIMMATLARQMCH